MALVDLIFPLTMLCILHCYGEFKCAVAAFADESIESQLQKLNKSPIKTIKTKEDGEFDCINLYEQPSLDHPLLHGHKIQMRPSSLPNRLHDETSSMQNNEYQILSSYFINCPKGTVPIRRTRKEDLIRSKSFTQSYTANIHPLTKQTPGRHQAIVRSIHDPNILYKGVEAMISIYNPIVQARQSSYAQMWVENGAPDVRNTLQTGWMVAPGLYGDNRTRFFIYWSVAGKNSVGCFNLLCHGFVQVDRRVALGNYFNPSKYNTGNQPVISITIFQDINTGDWWLKFPKINLYLGYWPKGLLPLLESGASQVIWGGQAIGRPNGMSPEMGNGHKPQKDFDRACYMANMKVIDKNNHVVDPDASMCKTENFVDNTNCYNIGELGHNGKIFRYSFLFGGPGGSNCGI